MLAPNPNRGIAVDQVIIIGHNKDQKAIRVELLVQVAMAVSMTMAQRSRDY